MKVYWTPFSILQNTDWAELAYFEPEPLLPFLAAERKSNPAHLKCFGMIEYLKNAYIIRSPMDYKLSIDSSGMVKTEDYNQVIFDAMIQPRTEPDATHRTLTINSQYVFFSDSSLQIEALPLFLDHSEIGNKIRVIPGSFDIGKWIRPVEVAFEIVDGVSEIVIKRGDPLMCIRFVANKKISLVRTESTDELKSVVKSCVYLKHVVPKQSLEKCYELAKHLVQRFLKRQKKCPFGWK